MKKNFDALDKELGLPLSGMTYDSDYHEGEFIAKGYISESHYEWMSDAWKSGEIKHKKEVLEKMSEEMKKNNPMHNPEAVEKMKQTKLAKFASGELKPNVMGEQARKETSERMKKNNPIHRFPERHNFKGNSYVKGRKWYNNGQENIYTYDEAPEGYVAGMMYKPRK